MLPLLLLHILFLSISSFSSSFTLQSWKLTHPKPKARHQPVILSPSPLSADHDKHCFSDSWPSKVASSSATLVFCPSSADEGLVPCSPFWPRVRLLFYLSPESFLRLLPVFISVPLCALFLDPTEPRSTALHHLHQGDQTYRGLHAITTPHIPV